MTEDTKKDNSFESTFNEIYNKAIDHSISIVQVYTQNQEVGEFKIALNNIGDKIVAQLEQLKSKP